MTRKIHICEWRAAILPDAEFLDLGNEHLHDLERRVRLRSFSPVEGKETIEVREWPLLFAERFEPELACLLAIDKNELTAVFAAEDAEIQQKSPFAELDSRDEKRVLRELIATIIANPLLETTTLKYMLGSGSLEAELDKRIRFDITLHARWRSILDVVKMLLNIYGSWIISTFQGDEQQAVKDIAKLPEGNGAQLWLELINKYNIASTAAVEAKPLSQLIYQEESITLPVHCPPAMLAEEPRYDHRDLYLTLAPVAIALMRKANFNDVEWCEYLADTMVLRDWNLSSKEDLVSLQRVFDRIRDLFQPPPSIDSIRHTDREICDYLDGIGCTTVEGLAELWRKDNKRFFAVRPVELGHDGIVIKNKYQIAIALGVVRTSSFPANLSTAISQSGALSVQMEGNVWLACMLCEVAELPKINIPALLDLAEEIAAQLDISGALESGDEEKLARELSDLPTLLEMDVAHLHRQFKLDRLRQETYSLVSDGRISAVDKLLFEISDQELRAELNSSVIVTLFRFDASEAIARIVSLEQGEERHDTISRALQAATDLEEKEIISQIAAAWLSDDAYYNPYRGDALSLLEIFTLNEGLIKFLNRFNDKMAVAVRADWLRLGLRKSPSIRNDQLWRKRLGNLTTNSIALATLSLERLVDLFEIMQKHGLSGRTHIVNAAIPLIRGSAYTDYWRARFGVKLSADSQENL